MKKTLLTFVLSTIALFGSVYAFSIYGDPDPIIVTINQPQNVTIFSNTFILNVSMNPPGNIKYSIDDGANITACGGNCSDFEVGLSLDDGGHHITVYGDNSVIENSSTVYFTINTSQLIVNLISPVNQTYDTNEIYLNIVANKIVFLLSYELDGTSHYVCFLCSNYETELNVEEGTHRIVAIANDVRSEDVYFTVLVNETGENETTTTTIPVTTTITTINSTTTTIPVTTTIAPTTTIPNTSTSTISSKYALGFQNLPKLYASGNVTDAELINILNNNKLNPGVLNRLIKTGKLTPEIITTILKTQFLPPGILNKILWYFGYGHNHLIEDIFDQYNITDEQFELILNHEIPPGTMKHILSSKPLTEEQIDLLLDEELKPDILKKLVEDQTLNNETIEKLLATQKLPNGLLKKLIENQKLTESNIQTVINKTDNPKTLDDLLKNQKPSDEQEEKIYENLPEGLQKKHNITVNSSDIPSIKPLGKQEGHKEEEHETETTEKPEKEEHNIVTTEKPEKETKDKQNQQQTEQRESKGQFEKVKNEDNKENPQDNIEMTKLKYQPDQGNEKQED